jgi:hypothetical protein
MKPPAPVISTCFSFQKFVINKSQVNIIVKPCFRQSACRRSFCPWNQSPLNKTALLMLRWQNLPRIWHRQPRLQLSAEVYIRAPTVVEAATPGFFRQSLRTKDVFLIFSQAPTFLSYARIYHEPHLFLTKVIGWLYYIIGKMAMLLSKCRKEAENRN